MTINIIITMSSLLINLSIGIDGIVILHRLYFDLTAFVYISKSVYAFFNELRIDIANDNNNRVSIKTVLNDSGELAITKRNERSIIIRLFQRLNHTS